MTAERAGLVQRLQARHVVWLATIAALIAFLPSLAGGFVFDDDPLIVRNPYAHELRYIPRCFTTDLWDTPERPDAASSTKFYRPLVCTSYIANYTFGGGSALSFHAVNVALHAATCALVALLALRWTGSSFAALLAALVFAVHPTRSENVEWISGRTDLLMAAFFFAAHELAVSAARTRGSWARWSASFSLYIAAILSKEFAVAWPLFLAVEWVLLPESGPERKRLATAFAASLVLGVAYLAIRATTFPIRPPEIESMALHFPLNVGYSLLSLGYYVERLVVPWPQTFHFRPVPIVNGRPVLFVPSVVLGAIAAGAFAGALIRALRRDRALAAMLMVTAVLFLPIINVSYTGFPGTTADRFLYLPLVPLVAALGRGAAPALARWSERPLAAIVVVAVTLVYSAVNWVRSLDYFSNETIWRHELEVNPENPQALAGLAEARANGGDIDGAFGLLRRALAPRAVEYRLLANPTRCYLGMLELDGPRLADGNTKALGALLREVSALAVGEIREDGGRAADLVLRMPPDEYAEVHVANASSHLAASGAFVASRLGDDRAVEVLAARTDRDIGLDAGARYNLALALGRAGDYARARKQLSMAIEETPSASVRAAAGGLAEGLARTERLREAAARTAEPTASLDRARAFLELGAYLRAARELRPAYRAFPENAEVRAVYFDALVAARLDSEALDVAGRMPGMAPPARVAEARTHLSARTASAIPPNPGDPW